MLYNRAKQSSKSHVIMKGHVKIYFDNFGLMTPNELLQAIEAHQFVVNYVDESKDDNSIIYDDEWFTRLTIRQLNEIRSIKNNKKLLSERLTDQFLAYENLFSNTKAGEVYKRLRLPPAERVPLPQVLDLSAAIDNAEKVRKLRARKKEEKERKREEFRRKEKFVSERRKPREHKEVSYSFIDANLSQQPLAVRVRPSKPHPNKIAAKNKVAERREFSRRKAEEVKAYSALKARKKAAKKKRQADRKKEFEEKFGPVVVVTESLRDESKDDLFNLMNSQNFEKFTWEDEEFIDTSHHNSLAIQKVDIGNLERNFKNIFEVLDTDVSKFLIATTILIRQLFLSPSPHDSVIAVYQYLSTDKLNDMVGINKKVGFSALVYSLHHMFSLVKKSDKIDGIQTESFIDTLGEAHGYLNVAIHSNLSSKIRGVLLKLMSLRFFNADFSNRLSTVVGKADYKVPVFVLVNTLFKDFIGLLKIGERLLQGENWSKIFLESDPLAVALKRGEKLLKIKDHLYTGLPVPGAMEINLFVSECTEVINVLAQAKKKIAPVLKKHNNVSSLLTSLELERGIVMSRINSSRRQTPLGIVLTGPPSIGKSKLITYLGALWNNVKGRDFHDGHIFHKNANEEHWENYSGFSHKVVHIAELGGNN
jgi:hypothetical protein